MKNVLLIGIGGVYNYGCEAIIRGTVKILHQIDPKIEISYASYNYDYDAKKLSDLKINIINRPRDKRRWTIRNITRKLCSILNIKYSTYDSVDWISQFDTLFSIGGDIYTLDENGGFNYSLPVFIEKCIKHNPAMNYILWGASVGPFTQNPKAERFYSKHLKKASLIVARENATINYLKSIGIESNVVFAPDPAFFVPFGQHNKMPNKRLSIGINLSPLSALYAYGDTNHGATLQAKTIESIITTLNADIVLIPHVLAPNINDDDLRYLKTIYDKIDPSLQQYVSIEHDDSGFIGRKKILSQLDCLIAARMHCAINAITCNTPTILLSYSAKAKGMAEFVYGDTSMICPLDTFGHPNAIIDLIKSRKAPDHKSKISNFNFNAILR